MLQPNPEPLATMRTKPHVPLDALPPLTAAALITLTLFSCHAPIRDETRARDTTRRELIARPRLYEPLTEPPCSYCSTQDVKGLIADSDPVVAWVRGAHNGGAIPLRHFLSGPRVINDTYGLFFYDPDGGYVSAFKKDYGYEFYGWRRGAMVVRGPDGTLWTALGGRAFAGPKKGQRLERIPSLTTTWGHWLMLHPESTAYDLFDGKTYRVTALPEGVSEESQRSMGSVDARLAAGSYVLGATIGDAAKAFPLDETRARACYTDELAGTPIAVFWYGPTRSAIAFRSTVDGRKLTFYADRIAPETAPFMDRETKTRWTLAGRGVDGPLRGRELDSVDSVRCRWFGWAAEHPDTAVHAVRQ